MSAETPSLDWPGFGEVILWLAGQPLPDPGEFDIEKLGLDPYAED